MPDLLIELLLGLDSMTEDRQRAFFAGLADATAAVLGAEEDAALLVQNLVLDNFRHFLDVLEENLADGVDFEETDETPEA